MCRSFGEWLREVLTEMRYFTTHLPRLPTLIARDISVRIALAAKDDERAARNAPFASRLAPGMKVRARYSEDGKMYDATLDRAAGPNDSIHYKGRWMVTYTEFGNGEIRSLGHLDLTDMVGDAGAAARDRSASAAHRSSSQAARDGGRHRSRSPSYNHGRHREEYARDRGCERGAHASDADRSGAGSADEDMESLRERVLARERNKVVVGAGRDYASRVMGLKESMTVRETHLSGSARAAADERRQVSHARGSDRRFDLPHSPPRSAGDRYAEEDRRGGSGGYRDSAYEPRARYRDDGWNGGTGAPYEHAREAAPYSRTLAAAHASDSTTAARVAAAPAPSSSTPVTTSSTPAPATAPAAAPKPSAAALSRMQELMKKYGGGGTAAAAPTPAIASAAQLGVQDRDGEHVQQVAGWSS